jgi:hypothetical protein
MARLPSEPLRACPGAAPSTKQTLRLLEHRVDVERDPARPGPLPCRACSKRVAALLIPLVRDATHDRRAWVPRGCDRLAAGGVQHNAVCSWHRDGIETSARSRTRGATGNWRSKAPPRQPSRSASRTARSRRSGAVPQTAWWRVARLARTGGLLSRHPFAAQFFVHALRVSRMFDFQDFRRQEFENTVGATGFEPVTLRL